MNSPNKRSILKIKKPKFCAKHILRLLRFWFLIDGTSSTRILPAIYVHMLPDYIDGRAVLGLLSLIKSSSLTFEFLPRLPLLLSQRQANVLL